MKKLVPIVVAIVGVMLLIGCFRVPTDELPLSAWAIKGTSENIRNNIDYAKMIGSAKSAKPVRVGVIDKKGVIALWGKPWLESSDGRSMAYAYVIRKSNIWYPICGFETGPGAATAYGFRLNFDENGLLHDVIRESVDEADAYDMVEFEHPSYSPWAFHKISELAAQLKM